MDINWKVRIQKKSFWTAVVSALIVFANSMAAAFGYDLIPVTEGIEATIMAVLNVLVLVGVIEDMTTKGVKDSERAKNYKRPQ